MQKIADLRTNAAARLEQVTLIRNEYNKNWKVLQDRLVLRDAILAKLVVVHNEIGKLRGEKNAANEATLNRFLPDWMKVTISLVANGDRSEFEKQLLQIFRNKGSSLQPKRVRGIILHNCTPISFAAACLKNEVGVELGGKTCKAEDRDFEFNASEDTPYCQELIQPFDHDEHADVPVLSQQGKAIESVLNLQETPWDDFEAILLNGDPVDKRSPGQRSSAMLPLIALAETTPLIIDQPEDNLDKRLVGTVLMKVLAELKEKRQIIVCTHDPNILVGGDAEQVVVLEAESDRRARVLKHGSIDNDDIVETVIDLLEGGQEAFDNRRKRYNML